MRTSTEPQHKSIKDFLNTGVVECGSVVVFGTALTKVQPAIGAPRDAECTFLEVAACINSKYIHRREQMLSKDSANCQDRVVGVL